MGLKWLYHKAAGFFIDIPEIDGDRGKAPSRQFLDDLALDLRLFCHASAATAGCVFRLGFER
jgi:hypothetical protein